MKEKHKPAGRGQSSDTKRQARRDTPGLPFRTRSLSSIVKLEPPPEDVFLLRGIAAGRARERDLLVKPGVLPVEDQLDVLVEIPVDADVRGIDSVGEERGVGQLVGKHVAAQDEVAETAEDFKGAQAAALPVVRTQGLDAPAVGRDLLA